VIDIEAGRFILREMLPALSIDALQNVTGAKLHVTDPVGDLICPEV